MKLYLKEGIKKLGLEIEEKNINMLYKYFELLQEYNTHTNLTAIRDNKDMIEKHFLDSLLLQKFMVQLKPKDVIDIGTGAGFPGMVLAIVNNNIRFSLMDSVGKKTKFLEKVVEELKLENVKVINSRAEDYINDENRESYDMGVCRGVNSLNVILEYIIPFLKVGGTFLSQKMEILEEKDPTNALEILNSEIVNRYKLELPNYKDKRVILEIKKIKETDKKYPRRAGIPLKRPL